MQEHIALSWKMQSCPILFHWKYFNTENSLYLLLWHKLVGLSQLSLFLLIKLLVSIVVIQSCLSPSFLLRVRLCPTSCLEHDHQHSFLPYFNLCCLDPVLLQTLPWNCHWLGTSKESFPTVGHLLWSLSVTLTNFIAHYLLVLTHLSVCLYSLLLISFYSINSLEQRFLGRFSARFPKHKNNSSREEASPARVSCEQKGHCLCSPIYH